MNDKENEQWLTRRHFNKSKRVGKSQKRTFAQGLVLSLDKPQNEVDEILFPIIKKYL